MGGRRVKFLFWGLLFWGIGQMAYSNELELEVSVNPSTAYINESFSLTFTLNHRDWGAFQLPDLDGFKILSGPSRSYRTTIVNGRMLQKTSYTYRLKAERTGNLTIGSATMQVNGKTLKSQPITVMVLEVDERGADTEQDLVIRTSLNCDTCFTGQQIIMDVELYSRTRITDFAILSDPEWQGLKTRRYFNLQNFGVERDTLNNRIYNKRVIRRYILYPQLAGTFSPVEIDIRVIEQDRDGGGMRSFFRGGGKPHYITISTPEIFVLPSPPNAPEGYNGLVGDFHLSAKAAESNVTQNDLLSMELTLRGNGDLKSMSIPPLNIQGGLSVADVQLEEEDISEYRGERIALKRWQILLRADSVGNAQIQPYVVAYQPQSDSFYTVSTEPIPISIQTASHSTGSQSISNGEKDHPFWKSPWFMIGIPVGAIALGIALFFLLGKPVKGLVRKKLDPGQKLRMEVKRAKETSIGDNKNYAIAMLQALDNYLSSSISLPLSRWREDTLEKELNQFFSSEKSQTILSLRNKLVKGSFGYQAFSREEVEQAFQSILDPLHSKSQT